MPKAQKWVKKKGNNESINSVANSITSKNLTGPLKIENFTKLKSIKLNKHKITSLTITGCSQLTKLDVSELTELTSLLVSDCLELIKLECSRSQLTSLKLSVNNKLDEINCCRNRLTELDVSDCPSLDELNCSHNSIGNLVLNLCPKITKLNCSNNQLIVLEISNCSRLESLDCSHNKLSSLNLRNRYKLESLNCSHNQLIRLYISNCPKLKDLKYSENPNLNEEDIIRKLEKDDKIRNLLIIGRTGGGKSALSNVLSGTDDFGESGYSVSSTKTFQKKEFNWNEAKYVVVDTMGVGDTNLKLKQVLLKIAEGIYSMPEGISQVLFVIDGRFKEEEIKTFDLFKNIILGAGILQYVTIVRTKFSNFRNKEECEKDKNILLKESQTIAIMVDSCRDIIHVDNPPIIIKGEDKEDIDELIEMNKKLRRRSRIKLLTYLEKECQENPYKLETWDKVRDGKSNIFNTIINAFDDDAEVPECCSII